MRVLTAGTVVDQPGDFAHTIPGELVRLSSVCDRDRYDPTGPCGCGRAFVGVASGKSTSVAVVADLDMTVEEYRAMLRRAGVRSDDHADALAEAVSDLSLGTLVRRTLDELTT